MESKAKLLGHPVHPMLIVFPLGLFIVALIFDVLYLATDDTDFATVAFWNIIAGIVGGLLAAVPGLIDWMAIPAGTRAKSIGLLHGAGNVVIVGLFGISWLLRLGATDNEPSIFAVVLAAVAVALGALTGWLGGELVDRMGVGVDPGAHLNSPNSLSDTPAAANHPAYQRDVRA